MTFETASSAPWTWSCASCTTTCAIVAPNLLIAPPATACSGTVQLAVSTAAIGIGDGPGNYANSASCTWVVSASGPITVTFSELNTEANYDFVKLYDGTSSSAPLLGSYSGTAVPGPVSTAGSAITIAFTSDNSGVKTGFAAKLTAASVDTDDTASKLVGTVPAALGDLWCIGRITSMCARSRRAFPFSAARRECGFLQGFERAKLHRPVARRHHAAAPTLVDVRPRRHVVGAARRAKAVPPQPRAEACSPEQHAAASTTTASLTPLSPLRSRRSTPSCTPMRASVRPVEPLHGVRSAWCRRNVARNALTGRFPAFVSSMPSIANLYVAHAQSVSVPPPLH